MRTLLEFITNTKGVEYLIAIAFLFAFLAFLQVTNYRGKWLVLRVIPLIILTLGFGGMAYTCSSPGAMSVRAERTGETPLLTSPVLTKMYGPASFDHSMHQDVVKGCNTCHHNSGKEFPPCGQCHSNSFDPDNLEKPGIAHVYHLRCISCHTENQAGPTECTGCHTQASVSPLPIAHPLSGAENCLSCHRGDVKDVPAIPADHNSATNGVCQLCHSPAAGAVSAATQNLPHPTTGRENCLMCHGEGIAGAAKVPADHAGRINDTCQLCHKS